MIYEPMSNTPGEMVVELVLRWVREALIKAEWDGDEYTMWMEAGRWPFRFFYEDCHLLDASRYSITVFGIRYEWMFGAERFTGGGFGIEYPPGWWRVRWETRKRVDLLRGKIRVVDDEILF